MPWTSSQQRRLATEKEILNQYFPGKVQWIDPSVAEKTRIEVEMISNSNQIYRLRAYVPLDYPHSVPDLVVAGSPTPMPDWDVSKGNLTLGWKDGCLKICHHYPPHWKPEYTFYGIFIMGRLWLEAYEGHLQTGNNLDYYLRHI